MWRLLDCPIRRSKGDPCFIRSSFATRCSYLHCAGSRLPRPWSVTLCLGCCERSVAAFQKGDGASSRPATAGPRPGTSESLRSAAATPVEGATRTHWPRFLPHSLCALYGPKAHSVGAAEGSCTAVFLQEVGETCRRALTRGRSSKPSLVRFDASRKAHTHRRCRCYATRFCMRACLVFVRRSLRMRAHVPSRAWAIRSRACIAFPLWVRSTL